MMKVLHAAYYEFKKNIRDIKMLVFLVVFPVLTTFILGTAIEGYFSADISKKIPVGFVNLDEGVIGTEFPNFLGNKEISKRLEIKNYDNKDEGDKALKDNRIDTLIYLPEGLSQSLMTENRKSIQLYGNENVEYIETLISGFTKSYNAVNAVVTVGGRPSESISSASNIKRIYFNKALKAPRAVDYYGVLVLLQMLIIGAIFGVFITARNYDSDIHIRVHSLPVSKWALAGGRILGSTAYMVLASVITIVCTRILYNVNWGGNPFIILGTIIVFSLIVVGIGVLIGLFIPSYSTALILVMLLMIFFGIFSGSVTPVSVNDSISRFVPNYHAKILLFGAIYRYSRTIMLQSASALLGMLVLVYGTAWIFIRRPDYDNI